MSFIRLQLAHMHFWAQYVQEEALFQSDFPEENSSTPNRRGFPFDCDGAALIRFPLLGDIGKTEHLSPRCVFIGCARAACASCA